MFLKERPNAARLLPRAHRTPGLLFVCVLAMGCLTSGWQASAQYINPRFGYIPTSEWDRLNRAGMEAFHQDNFAEAEAELVKALPEAEKFGSEDPRLATSLNNLAQVYHAQGRYPEAEPLYLKSLAIDKKVLGEEHPTLAGDLNNLDELYFA
jgi:tetratricopeptide (TPR) repeat protein